jgi:hypothetical protein
MKLQRLSRRRVAIIAVLAGVLLKEPAAAAGRTPFHDDRPPASTTVWVPASFGGWVPTVGNRSGLLGTCLPCCSEPSPGQPCCCPGGCPGGCPGCPPVPPSCPPSPPPPRVSAPPEVCTCDGRPCDGKIVRYSQRDSVCWEQNITTRNQNCSAMCGGWLDTPWQTRSTLLPAMAVATRLPESWRWVGTGRGSRRDKNAYPGALEFVTGNGTHCTMVYFAEKAAARWTAPGGADGALGLRAATGTWVVKETMRWLSEPAQQRRVGADVAVRQVLTSLWGCGPLCTGSSSALVDVGSDLAQMKFALMRHFQQSTLYGGVVSTDLWGGTAHIQVVQ